METFRIHHQQPIVSSRSKRSSHKQSGSEASFKQLFQSELQSHTHLKMSKHAENRLQERGISIRPETWLKIANGLEQARNKGVTDALVITNETAMVVNTKTNIVITAIDRQTSNRQIFTNINGTIVIDE